MGLWGKLTGELVDIVQFTEDDPEVLVHRFERFNNEIKNGGQLTVREGQLAIMVNEGQLGKGQLADVFLPGMYELTTQNLPLLSTLKGWKHGFDSPFRAEVYFFNTRLFNANKWGTPQPALMKDPEFGMVNVSAFGIYSMRIGDPKKVLLNLVGTKAELRIEDNEENLRGRVSTAIRAELPRLGVPVSEMNGRVEEVGEKLKVKLAPIFEKDGFELVEVQVQSIALPEKVQEAIDTRGAMGVVGANYGQYMAANAMQTAAANPGTPGMMMGVGVGGMMSQGMGQMFQQPMQTPQMIGAPPPMPGAPPPLVFLVSMNGQQAGPFDAAALARHISSGAMTRDSLVWRQGMPQWAKAGELPELSFLFNAAPPPLPGGPPPMPR